MLTPTLHNETLRCVSEVFGPFEFEHMSIALLSALIQLISDDDTPVREETPAIQLDFASLAATSIEQQHANRRGGAGPVQIAISNGVKAVVQLYLQGIWNETTTANWLHAYAQQLGGGLDNVLAIAISIHVANYGKNEQTDRAIRSTIVL